MPDVVSGKRFKEPKMCLTTLLKKDPPIRSKSFHNLSSEATDDFDSPILPGLPDDISKYCLALVPRSDFCSMSVVSKKWRRFMQSKEFITVRQLAGLLQEWLYVLTTDSEGKESRWEVLDSLGHQHRILPSVGPPRSLFGVVVLGGKLVIVGGFSVIDGTGAASSEVYNYDSCINRIMWPGLCSWRV